MLIEKGLLLSEVVILVAILGPAQVVGQSIMLMFSDKVSMTKPGVFIAAILPIVFTGFSFLPSGFWMLVPFAIAFGAATGTIELRHTILYLRF